MLHDLAVALHKAKRDTVVGALKILEPKTWNRFSKGDLHQMLRLQLLFLKDLIEAEV